MRQISPDRIKNVLEEEFSHVVPSRNIWQSVADTLPVSQNRYTVRKRTYRTVLIAAILIISVFTFVAAGTDPGREIFDQIFNNFLVHIIDNEQFEAQLKQDGQEPTYIGAMPLQGHEDKIPQAMKLPTYLPDNLKDFEQNSIYVMEENNIVAIRWFDKSGDGTKDVMIEYNEHGLGKGSETVTNGEAAEIQEVQIGNIKGFAFKDNNGWNINWMMDGHQYWILTGISLEEAIKIAESVK